MTGVCQKQRQVGKYRLLSQDGSVSDAWKPTLAAVDLRSMSLTTEEGFVASRIDGRTTLDELTLLTGFDVSRVKAIVARLIEEGAVLAPATPFSPIPSPQEDGEEPLVEEPASSSSHLKLYREVFHELSPDARVHAASIEQGVALSALCFDPLPGVIQAVLSNPQSGPEQLRLIAAHHQNSAGLEWLVQRPEVMRDAHVQRLLWRNPQLNEGQLRRLIQHKRLLEVWKLAVSREATAQTRAGTAKVLRTRFGSASAEEKVELIITTEGRALAGLAGIPVDGKTTALLCSRTYSSLFLVQNLANWPTAPPALIAHLLKQAIVARQPQLRAALSRHPNAPASAKRS